MGERIVKRRLYLFVECPNLFTIRSEQLCVERQWAGVWDASESNRAQGRLGLDETLEHIFGELLGMAVIYLFIYLNEDRALRKSEWVKQ